MAKSVSLFSRRNMILALFGGAASVGLLAAARPGTAPSGPLWRMLRQIGRSPRRLALASAEYDVWASQAGSLFTTDTGHVLRLAGVDPFPDRGPRPAGLRARGFTAVFDVGGGLTLPGDIIFRIAHARSGRFDIFLSAGAHPGRMLAVFN